MRLFGYPAIIIMTWSYHKHPLNMVIKRITQQSQHYTRLTTSSQRSSPFNQMAPPVRTITVALDMSKAFDTVNT